MDIKKYSRLPVEFTVNEVIDTNDTRFLAITIDVLHEGLNFNGSIFEHEIVDANAESIKNTPVLGYIAMNPDGVKDYQGHEYKEIETVDGKKYVYGGSAYGVVPESCNYRWVKKVSSDGVTRNYFRVDALLWTKFEEAVSIFEKDGGKPHSMELELSSIEGEELEDGTFKFTKFNFNGCCLLSSTDESIEPAMIDSIALPVFSVDTISQDIKKKLNEYSRVSNMNGGKAMSKPINDFALTIMEKLDEIRALLDEHRFIDKWGYESGRYYLTDVQGEEVIVCDRKDHYRLYGIPYTMDGDNIKLDYDNKKRKKTQYADFEESGTDEPIFTIENVVAGVADFMEGQVTSITGEKDTAVENYTTLKSEYDNIKPKYDNYVAEAEKREAEAIETAKSAEFEKFDAHLSDNEKYSDLKKNRDHYTLEEIRSECAILFTEKNINTDFSKNPKSGVPMTAGVPEVKPEAEINPRYGVLATK